MSHKLLNCLRTKKMRNQRKKDIQPLLKMLMKTYFRVTTTINLDSIETQKNKMKKIFLTLIHNLTKILQNK